jgi:hypothetical protein
MDHGCRDHDAQMASAVIALSGEHRVLRKINLVKDERRKHPPRTIAMSATASRDANAIEAINQNRNEVVPRCLMGASAPIPNRRDTSRREKQPRRNSPELAGARPCAAAWRKQNYFGGIVAFEAKVSNGL